MGPRGRVVARAATQTPTIVTARLAIRGARPGCGARQRRDRGERRQDGDAAQALALALPRRAIAEAVTKLVAADAAVIGIDLMFLDRE